MSNETAKIKNSARRFKDETAVKRQVKIAKQSGSFTDKDRIVKESHRLAKHHAMDCGNPQCALCGNPRHIHKDGLTAQEKRLFQDLDNIPAKHSNGLLPKDE